MNLKQFNLIHPTGFRGVHGPLHHMSIQLSAERQVSMPMLGSLDAFWKIGLKVQTRNCDHIGQEGWSCPLMTGESCREGEW